METIVGLLVIGIVLCDLWMMLHFVAHPVGPVTRFLHNALNFHSWHVGRCWVCGKPHP